MKNFDIYRNDVIKLLSGFSKNFKKVKERTGNYPINGLLVTLLGEANELSKKIMKAENFVLTKTEKQELCEVLEQYIFPRLKNFKNSDPLEDPCIEINYKGNMYYANSKGVEFQFERDTTKAMSLHSKFYDPNDEDIIEIRYHASEL